MRSFEVLLIVANLLALLWPLMSGPMRRQWLVFVPGIAFLLLFAHIAWEGYRWQMLPAYLCTAVLFIGGQLRFWWFKSLPNARRRWALAVAGSSLGMLLLCLATLASSLVPIFEFPAHSGPFAVGRRSLAAVPGGDPWLQLWYPAKKGSEQLAPYLLDLDRPASAFPSLSHAFFRHFQLLRSQSTEGSELHAPDGPLPLIVFFQHRQLPLGWSSFLCEDLASQGFAVLGVDNVAGFGVGAQTLAVAIEELKRQPEAASLAMQRFAILGQGEGAAVASHALSSPSALAALYLSPAGELLPSAEKPCMVMAGAGLETELPSGIRYRLKLLDFEPLDFTDLTLMTSLEIDGLHGAVDGERCLQIVAAYARAFFREQLLEQEEALLSGASEDYPEVSFSGG